MGIYGLIEAGQAILVPPDVYDPWSYIDGETGEPVVARPNSAYGPDTNGLTGVVEITSPSTVACGATVQRRLGPTFDPVDVEHFGLWLGDPYKTPKSVTAPNPNACRLFIAKIETASTTTPGAISTQRAQRGVVRGRRAP